MTYQAIVSRISVRPHPNADRLQLGLCHGNQVVVGLDTKEGDLGVFFPTDGQLSEKFCLENNLYNASARAKLDLPPSDKLGFFDTHRRVRAQSFRGLRSDGYWVPTSFFHWAGNHNHVDGLLTEGTTFDSLCGEAICNKYYNPKTLRALSGQVQKTVKKNRFFPEHIDTTQFRFVADTIPDDGVYYITEKLHGTSGRMGLVFEDAVLPWYARGWNSFAVSMNIHFETKFPCFQDLVYTELNGSRRVTLGKSSGTGFYGSDEFRLNATKNLTLHKGEILFFELVGWTSETGMIMPAHDATKTKDKTVIEKYGPSITYTYGCPQGECRLYLYKIAHTNEDGIITEQPWTHVAARARELGLATVPLLAGPLTANVLMRTWATDSFSEALRKEVESYALGHSSFGPQQLKEGVVLRVESPTTGITHVKNKQFLFGVLEGFWKEKDDSVDMEDLA